MNDLTLGEIEDWLQQLWQDGDAYRCDLRVLVHRYLAFVLDGERRAVFASNPETLRRQYIEATAVPEERVPREATAFYRYVAKNDLCIDRAPRDALLGLLEDAGDDLAEIRARLADMKRRMQQLQGDDSDTQKAEHSRLKYYSRQNEAAEREIVEWLASVERRRDSALRAIRWYGRMLGRGPWFAPYSYRSAWGRRAYDPDQYSPLRNTFPRLRVSELRALHDAYEKDPAAIDAPLRDYIAEHDVPTRLRNALDTHHSLAARKPIVDELLGLRAQGRHAVFCQAVPSLIEGILDQIYVDAGVAAERGELAAKLEKVARTGVLLELPYYLSDFRVLRNRVAHGRLVAEDERERISALLLLDLMDVVEMTLDEALPVNAAVAAVRDAGPSHCHDERAAVALLNYARTVDGAASDPRLPAFYQLGPAVDALLDRMRSPGFWSWLAGRSRADRFDAAAAKGLAFALSSTWGFVPSEGARTSFDEVRALRVRPESIDALFRDRFR